MKISFLNCFLFIILALAACKTSFEGDTKLNLPPETFTIVDTIIREGDDRLNSQVEIAWWGDDADGYIAAFEFTFDSIINENTVWHYTTLQDSIFLLATPPGKDTLDFPFYVRAIDNLGMKDPTPAHLIYPVKNSPPSVVFVYAENNPVKSFPVLRFYWQVNDPDGIENLKQYELCWNDTSQLPYQLDIIATSAVFEATTLQTNYPDCNVYINNNLIAQNDLMSGLVLNDSNMLYIRAVDNADAKSPYIASTKVFVKKPVSDYLMVDGYTSNGSTVETFYATQLAAAGFTSVDTMQLFEKVNGIYTQQSADNISQSKLFALFKGIIWFTNDASNSLSLGQRTLNEFFDKGGKLLMSVYVSSLFDEQSGFLDFTPIQSFTLPADTTLLLTDTSKLFNLQPGYPELKSSAFVGVVRPFVPVVGATSLYNSQLIA
ncbi:MAG: hypothetical protein LH473_13875, partial [Chitinophagales bacterium]|nr:hypothetical protein [Chitinophagales bacterium]